MNRSCFISLRLLVSIPVFLTLVACAQTKTVTLSKKTRAKIDQLFKTCSSVTPGYAVGVLIPGQKHYTKGYGSANLDYELPITDSSVFDIASVSKQFTAACIAILILENKISLETPAFELLPELKKYKDTIRIKHLVYNTSGITDYYRLPRTGGRSWITFQYFDIDECIQTTLSLDTLLFKPGTRWDYCNVNFMLLTKIVERVSGMSFAEYSKKYLFDPLEMNNTLIDDDITQVVRNRVTPYNERTRENKESYDRYGVKISASGQYIQHPRTSPHYGGSGIKTTVQDLLNWSENMLTKKLGGKEFYELMHKTIQFEHKRDNQAFGLYHGSYRGRKTVAWDGGDWGISSQLIRFPEKGVAIIVLSNLGSGEAFRKANEIADILIQEGIL
jgi:CubicO group peptidase (beta-lactamase class C family)